jgi:hypothetical protein
MNFGSITGFVRSRLYLSNKTDSKDTNSKHKEPLPDGGFTKPCRVSIHSSIADSWFKQELNISSKPTHDNKEKVNKEEN